MVAFDGQLKLSQLKRCLLQTRGVKGVLKLIRRQSGIESQRHVRNRASSFGGHRGGGLTYVGPSWRTPRSRPTSGAQAPPGSLEYNCPSGPRMASKHTVGLVPYSTNISARLPFPTVLTSPHVCRSRALEASPAPDQHCCRLPVAQFPVSSFHYVLNGHEA